jgi:hypothetical protein
MIAMIVYRSRYKTHGLLGAKQARGNLLRRAMGWSCSEQVEVKDIGSDEKSPKAYETKERVVNTKNQPL